MSVYRGCNTEQSKCLRQSEKPCQEASFNMKTYDLHGYKVMEARHLIESVIGKIRLEGREEQLNIITGRGAIREEINNLLDQLQIDHRYEFSNDAIIIATVD